MYYQDYNPEVLKKIQAILLMMLKDFNDLCDKHGIDYFAGGGTAIGAVRHKGIIPWDDDIDLNMTRDNYEKFLAVAEKEYGDKYRIVHTQKNPTWPLMSTRWILNGTVFSDFSMRDESVKMGIFLDLYCFEKIHDDEKLGKKQWKNAWFWGKLMTLRMVPKPMLFCSGIKAKVLAVVCYFGSWFLRIFTTQAFLYKMVYKYTHEADKENTKRVAYFFDVNPYKSVIETDDISPTYKHPFGNTEIRLAKNTEAYLSLRFGDYMTIPPVDKRHNHPPAVLDFGPYENIELD